MKLKQKQILEGQIIAACNILREAKQETHHGIEDRDVLLSMVAFQACEAVRKFLRAVGEYETEEDIELKAMAKEYEECGCRECGCNPLCDECGWELPDHDDTCTYRKVGF